MEWAEVCFGLCNNVDIAIGLDPEEYMVDDTDDDNRNNFYILQDF